MRYIKQLLDISLLFYLRASLATVHLTVLRNQKISLDRPIAMVNPHYARLMASNRRLLQTGKYSDLVIKCEAREWHVHRFIICERSKFFATACDGPFLESSSKEIVLEDDDPTIVERLLSYLYTLDYEDGFSSQQDHGSPSAKSATISVEDDLMPPPMDYRLDNSIESEGESSVVAVDQPEATKISTVENSTENGRSSLMINVQVYAVAEKYDVEELKGLALEKFKACTQGWPLPDFPSVVHEALSSTPENDRGLRVNLKNILAEHVEEICPVDDLTLDESSSAAINDTRQQWCNALREEGRFLYQVLGTVSANRIRDQERLRLTNADIVADLQDAQSIMSSLKLEIKLVKGQCGRLLSELGDVKARGVSLLQEIDSRDDCRHCHHEFRPMFEDIDEWHRRGTLRCKNCRTKHNF